MRCATEMVVYESLGAESWNGLWVVLDGMESWRLEIMVGWIGGKGYLLKSWVVQCTT